MVQSSMTEKKQVYSAYRKAEQHMIMALKARKGEIKVKHSSTMIKVLDAYSASQCWQNINKIYYVQLYLTGTYSLICFSS